MDHGRIESGQTVVVVGAGGDVGTLAVQLARNADANVIAAGRPRVADLALGLGAEAFVDLTGPVPDDLGPAALIFDTVGGPALDACWPLLGPGGRVVSAAEPPSPERAAAHDVEAMYFVVEPDRRGLAELARLAEERRLVPVVGATSRLEEGVGALVHKQDGGVSGKLALIVRDLRRCFRMKPG